MSNSIDSEQNNEELSTEDLKQVSGGAAYMKAKVDGIKESMTKEISQDFYDETNPSNDRCTTSKNKQEP